MITADQIALIVAQVTGGLAPAYYAAILEAEQKHDHKFHTDLVAGEFRDQIGILSEMAISALDALMEDHGV